jgi:spore maturation protein SpmA
MLNYIWLALVVLAVVMGGYNTIHPSETLPGGGLDAVIKAAFDMAKTAVMDIALPLSAIMTIWLGVMRLADRAGLVQVLARALRPVLRWLFPDVPAEHPAMGSMVMNIAANMLGLGNAATPLGLRAMQELQKLNPYPNTATNAMCTFLAINTASIQLIPATAVGLLAIKGSKNPTAIVGTAFLATVCAQIVGLTAVKTLQKLPMFRPRPEDALGDQTQAPLTNTSTAEKVDQLQHPATPLTPVAMAVLIGFMLFFVWLLIALSFPQLGFGPKPGADAINTSGFSRVVNAISLLAIPFFLSFFPLYAFLRRIKVYEEFVDGAKEGFQVAVRIIPYLVTILAAVAMFRAAHGIELIAIGLKPLLTLIGFPPELLSLAFMRPLSGSGSMALLSDVITHYGPDHIFSKMAATMYGSTETTFYVVAVYFGAVGIRRTRHAIAAGLLADTAGIIASVVICKLVLAP